MENGLNRRDLFKKGFQIGAGVVGAGMAIKIEQSESLILEKGYFISKGVRYFPLYEKHPTGPETRLHPETDALFIEQNVNLPKLGGDFIIDDLYSVSVEKLVSILLEDKKGTVSASKKMVYKAAELQIPIALGDIDASFREMIKMFNVKGVRNKKDTEKFWRGIVLILILSFPDVVQHSIKDRLEKNEYSRRDFLKFITTGGLALVGSLIGLRISTNTAFFENLTDNKDSFSLQKRFLSRIKAMATHLHPEDTAVFMRNIIIA